MSVSCDLGLVSLKMKPTGLSLGWGTRSSPFHLKWNEIISWLRFYFLFIFNFLNCSCPPHIILITFWNWEDLWIISALSAMPLSTFVWQVFLPFEGSPLCSSSLIFWKFYYSLPKKNIYINRATTIYIYIILLLLKQRKPHEVGANPPNRSPLWVLVTSLFQSFIVSFFFFSF